MTTAPASPSGQQVLDDMRASGGHPRDMLPAQIRSVRSLLDSSLFTFAYIVCGFRDLYPPLHGPVCTLLESWGQPHYRRIIVQLPRGAYKCDTPSCMVHTKRGPVRAGDLRVGDELLALSDEFELTHNRIVSLNRSRAPLVRIKMRSGVETIVTPNHPFRTVLGWSQASDLYPGQGIAAPRRLRCSPPSGHLPYTAGAFCGDGCFAGPTPTLTCFDLEIVAACRREGAVLRQRNTRPEVYSLLLDSSRLLPRDSWSYSKEKKIPACYEGSSEFLSGLFDTDGSVGGNAIILVTTSDQLAKDVTRNLRYFGIFARRRRYQSQGPNGFRGWAWHVSFGGLDNVERFQKEIGFKVTRKAARLASLVAQCSRDGSGIRSEAVPPEWRKLLRSQRRGNHPGRCPESRGDIRKLRDAGIRVDNSYWTSRQKLRRAASVLGRSDLLHLTSPDVVWDRVESVEPLGTGPIVQMEVSGNRTYLGDCLWKHNSSVGTIANALWQITREPDSAVAIFNKRQANTKKWLRAMRSIVQGGDWFRVLYPDLLPPGISEGTEPPKKWRWNDEELLFQRSVYNIPEASITGEGVGASATGGHWPKIIKDDLIDAEDRDSPATMEAAWQWLGVSQHLERPAGRGQDLIMCTPWAYGDVYARLLREQPYDEATGEGYRLYRRSAIENGSSIFPHEWSTADLMREYRADAFSFMCLRMCLPRPSREVALDLEWVRKSQLGESGGGPAAVIHTESYDPDILDADIDETDIPPRIVPFQWCNGGVLFDPAPTEQRERKREPGSRNGLVAERIDPWGRRFVLEARGTRDNPHEVAHTVFQMLDRWGLHRVYVEESVLGLYARHILNQEALRQGRSIHIVPVPHKGRPKDTRIATLIPKLQRGLYYFLDTGTQELVQEMMEYPAGTSRDLLDALAYDEAIHRPESPAEAEFRLYQRDLHDSGESGRDVGPTGTGW